MRIAQLLGWMKFCKERCHEAPLMHGSETRLPHEQYQLTWCLLVGYVIPRTACCLHTVFAELQILVEWTNWLPARQIRVELCVRLEDGFKLELPVSIPHQLSINNDSEDIFQPQYKQLLTSWLGEIKFSSLKSSVPWRKSAHKIYISTYGAYLHHISDVCTDRPINLGLSYYNHILIHAPDPT